MVTCLTGAKVENIRHCLDRLADSARDVPVVMVHVGTNNIVHVGTNDMSPGRKF